MRALSHWAGCGWFWAWALVGAAYGLMISAIGILLFLPASLAVVLMTRRRPIRGAFGLVTGVGSVLLFVAYGGSYDLVHWLVPGLVLFTAGLVGHALTDAC
jgi:hypothetical protein